MLKVTVQEKGGNEKVYFFDEGEEVFIGRLQSNRIVLPKPNISKRHATLTVSSGKVIVTDLGSTNGTYVNGRRISEPREISESDRIYIGDFVIRARVVASEEEVSSVQAAKDLASPFQVQSRPTIPVGQEALEPVVPLAAKEVEVTPPPPPPPSEESPIPIELDVEIVTDEVVGEVPPREAEPQGIEVVQEAMGEGKAALAPGATVEKAQEEEAPEAPTTLIRAAEVAEAMVGASTFAIPASPPAERRESDDYMVLLREVGRRAESEVFLEPVSAEMTEEEWEALSDKVFRWVSGLQKRGELPLEADANRLTQDLLFEFVGLGPLEELLSDPNVKRVLVDGPDRIFVTRGERTEAFNRFFVSDTSLARAISRILKLAGITEEDSVVLEGRLADGTYVNILRPPIVQRPLISLERPTGSMLSPADLVKAGVFSQDVAERLEDYVKRRCSIAIIGPGGSGKTVVLNAICKVIPSNSRVLIFERKSEVVLGHVATVRIHKDFYGQRCSGNPGLISRLYPDYVVIPEIEAGDGPLLASLGLCGQKGVLTTVLCATLEECLRRIEVILAWGGAAFDPTIRRSMVHSLFDVVAVMGLDRSGRPRVVDLVELEQGHGLSK